MKFKAMKEKFLKNFKADLELNAPAKPLDLTLFGFAEKVKLKEKMKGTKFRQMCAMPVRERTWNPVRKFPRNFGCFCGSGEKAKKCCLPHIAPTVSKKFAGYVNENWEHLLDGKLHLPRAPKTQ